MPTTTPTTPAKKPRLNKYGKPITSATINKDRYGNVSLASGQLKTSNGTLSAPTQPAAVPNPSNVITPSLSNQVMSQTEPIPEPKFLGGEKLFTSMTGQQIIKNDAGQVVPNQGLENYTPDKVFKGLVKTGAELLPSVRAQPIIKAGIVSGIKSAPKVKNAAGTWNEPIKNVDDLINSLGDNIYLPKNSKEASIMADAIVKASPTTVLSHPAWKFIGVMLGTYGISEWARLDNVKTGLSTISSKAIQSKDPELIAEMLQITDEVMNPSLLDTMMRIVPGTNMASAFYQGGKITDFSFKINNKLGKALLEQINSGVSPDSQFIKDTQERLALEKQSTDYFNQQRLITEQKLLELKQKDAEREQRWKEFNAWNARDENFLAEKRLMEKQSKFWIEHQKKLDAMEAQDRLEQARFWLEYSKAKAQADLDNTPSKLSFGLV